MRKHTRRIGPRVERIRRDGRVTQGDLELVEGEENTNFFFILRIFIFRKTPVENRRVQTTEHAFDRLTNRFFSVENRFSSLGPTPTYAAVMAKVGTNIPGITLWTSL